MEEIVETENPQLPSLLGTLLAVALRMMLAPINHLDKADEIGSFCFAIKAGSSKQDPTDLVSQSTS